jgi:hypothetical protein
MGRFYVMIRPEFWRLLPALALASCIGTYQREIEETRAGLIGKTGMDLRDCLGVPADFDANGDDELLIYRWVFDEQRPASPEPATIGSGMGGITIGRRSNDGRADPMGFPAEDRRQSTCELAFTLDKSGVTKVDAHGTDETGLRADGACILRARQCVYKNEIPE